MLTVFHLLSPTRKILETLFASAKQTERVVPLVFIPLFVAKNADICHQPVQRFLRARIHGRLPGSGRKRTRTS